MHLFAFATFMVTLLATVHGQGHALQQTPTAPPGLTTSGTGEIVIPPDWVILRFGVSARDSTASVASQRGQRLVDRVIDTLVALGVSPDSLQMVELEIGPNRECAGERRILDYEARPWSGSSYTTCPGWEWR